MENYKCFIKNGSFCCVPISDHLTLEQQSLKGYAMVSQYPKNNDEYNENEQLSKYLINIKYLHCMYSKNINERCDKLFENVFR